MAGLVAPAVADARTSASRGDSPRRARASGSRRVAVSSNRRMLSGGLRDEAHGQPAPLTLDHERPPNEREDVTAPGRRAMPLHPLPKARGERVRPGGRAEVVGQPPLGSWHRVLRCARLDPR